MDTTTKQCSKCGEVKPLDGFYKKSTVKSGITSHCKECIRRKSSEWAANNKDMHRSRSRAYAASNRERLNAAAVARNKKNPDQVKARRARYAESHPDKVKESKKKWQDEHIDRRRECNRARMSAQRRDLADPYVIAKLIKGVRLNADQIPPDLIELKRQQLLMYRATKQLINSIKEKQSGNE